MDKLKELVVKFLSNANYINFFNIFVVAATAYLLARYNLTTPGKLKIKESRLKLVYLPLYKLFLVAPKTPSIQDAITIHDKITDILNAHYELVHPQLHRLNSELELKLSFQKEYSEVLSCIFRHVSINYELLKKSLGYPSETIYTIFIRMDLFQKFEYVLGYLNVFWFISTVTSSIYCTINPETAFAYLIAQIMLIYLLVIIILNIVYMMLNERQLRESHKKMPVR